MKSEMTAADLGHRLVSLPSLVGIPRQELEWLAAHGRLEVRAAGRVMAPTTGMLTLSRMKGPVGDHLIEVDSRPGRTQFRVSLAEEQAAATQVGPG